MKVFYSKMIIFFGGCCIILFFLDLLSMTDLFRVPFAILTNSYTFISTQGGSSGSDEIKPYISKVQLNDDTEALIIGDSVCNQMFNGLQVYNDNITIAGSNAAIMMTGQYILVEEYIKNHPKAKDVYLIVLPETLIRTFDTKFGYQYAVMPFVETGTLKWLDDETVASMESVYGKIFMNKDVASMIDKSGINRKIYLNLLKKYSHDYQTETKFEIAEKYIGKMYELCKENGVSMHLYACCKWRTETVGSAEPNGCDA